MDPLSVSASIIAVLQATAVAVRYISDVHNAPKERRQCEQEMLSTYQSLASLRDEIELANAGDPWFRALGELTEKDGPLDQYATAVVELHKTVERFHGVRKVWKSLTWPLIKDNVLAILSRIERLKSLTQIALQRDHFKLSLAIKADVGILANLMMASANDTQEIKRTLVSSKADLKLVSHGARLRIRQEFLDWISTVDFGSQHQKLVDTREPSTGEWILAEKDFVEWCTGRHHTLFCPGHPGTGKSIIAALIVERLSQNLGSDLALAYWYCNFKTQDDQNLTSILAALLRQLIEGLYEIPETLEQMYNPLRAKIPPSLQQIQDALCYLARHLPRIYIIIDALDECTTELRVSILGIIRLMQGHGPVQLLATSRLVPNIERLFHADMRLEIKAVDADIAIYAQNRLTKHSESMRRRNDLRKQVVDAVIHSTKGMFLLARLYLDAMTDMWSVNEWKAMLTRLSSLSRSSTEDNIYGVVYEHTMTRIASQSQTRSRQAMRILSWIVMAKGELSATELQHAIAIQPTATEFDEDDLVDITDLLSLCAGLIIHDDVNDIVRIVHYTAQQYLQSNRDRWLPESSLILASTCLAYLTFEVFAHGPCKDDDSLAQRVTQNPLLVYAACNLIAHTQDITFAEPYTPHQRDFIERMARFLSDNSRVLSFIQVPYAQQRNLAAPTETSMKGAPDDKSWLGANLYTRGTTGFHVAATHGLLDTLRRLTALTLDEVNDQDQLGRTPLSYAAENGHRDVVDFLLQLKTVRPETRDMMGAAPLAYAANGNTEEHQRIARLLLQHDAVDVDIADNDYLTPLLYAVARGSLDMVSILLEANPNRRVCCYALSLATSEGDLAIVDIIFRSLGRLTNVEECILQELFFYDNAITEEYLRSATSRFSRREADPPEQPSQQTLRIMDRISDMEDKRTAPTRQSQQRNQDIPQLVLSVAED